MSMAISAEIGIVSTHAQTIFVATPQRTALSRFVAPTPIIAPVMVCVVLTGMPKCVAPKMVMAPAVSAQKPPTGLSFVSPTPIVLTILQPPDIVPAAIAAAHANFTQSGTISAPCGSFAYASA